MECDARSTLRSLSLNVSHPFEVKLCRHLWKLTLPPPPHSLVEIAAVNNIKAGWQQTVNAIGKQNRNAIKEVRQERGVRVDIKRRKQICRCLAVGRLRQHKQQMARALASATEPERDECMCVCVRESISQRACVCVRIEMMLWHVRLEFSRISCAANEPKYKRAKSCILLRAAAAAENV